MRFALLVLVGGCGCLDVQAAVAGELAETPRIDSVVMSRPQPHELDPAVIWYDDFDGPVKPYTESQGELDARGTFGGQGRSPRSSSTARRKRAAGSVWNLGRSSTLPARRTD
jgi:hypothetical protein